MAEETLGKFRGTGASWRRAVYCALAALGWATVAWGQAASVSPNVLKLSMRPGTSTTQTLTISASRAMPEKVTYEVEVVDWWRTKRGEDLVGRPGTMGTRSAALWTTVSPSAVDVLPGKAAKVEVGVAPPSGTKGGYYAALSVSTVLPRVEKRGNHNILVKSTVYVPILVAVEGGKPSLGIESARCATTNTVLRCEVSARNLGDVHATYDGSLLLFDTRTQLVAKVPLRSQAYLPGEAFVADGVWPEPVPQGTYEAAIAFTGQRPEDGGASASLTLDVTWERPSAPRGPAPIAVEPARAASKAPGKKKPASKGR